MSERNKNFINAVLNDIDQYIFRDTVNNKDHKALALDKEWIVSDDSKHLVIELFEKEFLSWYLEPNQRLLKREDKLNQFSSCLANLKLTFPMRPLRVSLHTNVYSKNSFFSTLVIDIVRWLEIQKYVISIRGYSLEDQLYGLQTRIVPTKMFRENILEKLNICNTGEGYKRGKLITLRNKDKENISFEDTTEIKELRERIDNINMVNGKHDVVFRFRNSLGYVSTNLHAVFNNSSFEENGRLYTGILGFQILPKKQRKTILINGEQTIERDYSAHHPRILYALKGINYLENPYEVIFPMADAKMIKILKTALLVLVNAKNHQDSVRGCFFKLREDRTSFSYLKDKGLKIMDLFNAIKAVHTEIADFFSGNAGLSLSNIDSKIALRVVEHFTSQGKACLPIHDSFIVNSKDDDELVDVMKSSYRKTMQEITNTNINISCIVR